MLPAYAWDITDNVLWLEGAVRGKLAESVTLGINEQMRYLETGGFQYYRHTELSVDWAFARQWSIAPAYRHIMARSRNSGWIAQPMWQLNLNNKTAWGLAEFRTRLRITYIHLDQLDDLTDFRPKVTLLPFQGWTAWNTRPYLSDELIYNFEDNLIYRNRLSIGIRATPLDPLDLEAFLMQELTRPGAKNEWQERFVIGAKATLSF